MTNLAAIVIPFAAFVLAVVLLWGRLVEWIDLAVLAVGYALTCLGVTVGFHRLLTHRSFETYPAVRYSLAVLGTLAVEGSVIKWVADHRKHHDFADEDGDPHSPHDPQRHRERPRPCARHRHPHPSTPPNPGQENIGMPEQMTQQLSIESGVKHLTISHLDYRPTRHSNC